MFYVYILQDKFGKLYTGYTNDLRRRLQQHIKNHTKSTKNRAVKCIYYEACIERSDALRREHYLKTSQGKRMIQQRLKDFLYKQRNAK